jgi:hypothetical protein
MYKITDRLALKIQNSDPFTNIEIEEMSKQSFICGYNIDNIPFHFFECLLISFGYNYNPNLELWEKSR